MSELKEKLEDYVNNDTYHSTFMTKGQAQEILLLYRWKKEQIAVTKPLFDFAYESDLFKVGDNIHQKTVEYLKRVEQLEENESDSISIIQEADRKYKELQQQNQRLRELIDFFISEIDSNPMAVQFFDLRLVNEAKEALKTE